MYYIINLSGVKDTEIKLVDQETWNWINNPSLPIPLKVIEDYKKEHENYGEVSIFGDEEQSIEEYVKDCLTNSSSPENDMALLVEPSIGQTFWSIGSVMKFIKQNKLEVSEESYEGYIY